MIDERYIMVKVNQCKSDGMEYVSYHALIDNKENRTKLVDMYPTVDEAGAMNFILGNYKWYNLVEYIGDEYRCVGYVQLGTHELMYGDILAESTRRYADLVNAKPLFDE